ncbi:MAG: hypothetical protein DMF64_05810 [Acidobacteria bacterium]|nr:MAG: hypothetical protein DMF64_05810 [Acidobacteriota bacterium]
MPNDPALASDTCIFLEAITGDGGSHNNNDVWWLSPDIKLVGPASGIDKADPGVANPVAVTVHRKPDADCTLTPGTESIVIEVWVGNPSLAMTPDNPASTTLIQSIGSPLPNAGDKRVEAFDWTPPAGLPAADPQSPGHKCLIVRCYPDPLTPSAKNFFVPDEPHVAQHNICIVPCGGPQTERIHPRCGLNIQTVNVHADIAETVTFRAVFDRRPNPFVREVVLRRLSALPDFKRLSAVRPRRFNLILPDFPDAQVSDQTQPGCLGGLFGGGRLPPTFEVRVELQPAQFTHLRFNADISNATPGDAFIFHIRQVGSDGHDQGGLTAVMVAV